MRESESRLSWATQARVASGINSLLAAWLILSAWIYASSAGQANGAWAMVLTGFVLGVSATLRCLWPQEGVSLSWSNLFLGGWIALSPWALDYADDPPRLWNSGITGILVIVLAVWSITATAEHARQLRTRTRR